MVTIDAVLHISWQDVRLTDNVGCRFALNQIWHPQIQLTNSGELFGRQTLEVVVRDGGRLEGAIRLRGEVSDPRDVAEFPFDKHVIQLDVVSILYGSDEVVFEVNDQLTTRREVLSIPDWRVGEASAEVLDMPLPQWNRDTSAFRFSLPVERLPEYYIYKIILPLIMIVVMSWAVFWVSPDSLGPQMSLSGMSMLTLVTFQFTMNDLLPRVGYFTQLDKFILGSSILVFLALLEAVSTGYLAAKGNINRARQFDRVSRVSFPIVYAITAFGTLIF